ncbi:hypothetical protein X962_5634 [Burkholderia pseudomallei MSHR7343]|nr:hypothetical protein X962_5634 [Burkholderia pseudomallei MSHR7343]
MLPVGHPTTNQQPLRQKRRKHVSQNRKQLGGCSAIRARNKYRIRYCLMRKISLIYTIKNAKCRNHLIPEYPRTISNIGIQVIFVAQYIKKRHVGIVSH